MVRRMNNMNQYQASNGIKIGALYPLSGALAPVGKSIQHALELAWNIINNQYELSLPLADVLGQQFLTDAIDAVRALKALNWFPDGWVVQDAGYVVPDFLKAVGEDGNYIISRAAWARHR